MLGDPGTQRFFGRPSPPISQIREHTRKQICSDVWRRNRRTKVVLDRVIIIDRFHMCDEGRAETEASGTHLLEHDLIPMEDWNRGAFAECFRSTIHIEIVRRSIDFASLKDNRVALDPLDTSFARDV